MSMEEAKYPMSATLAHQSVPKDILELHSYTAMALCKTAIAPIDRVKLLLQNERGMMLDGRLSEPYKGFRNCFLRTIKAEGFASLWRGNAVNLIRYLPAQGITFGIWDAYRRYRSEIGFRREEVGCINWFVESFRAGFKAGGFSILISHPMDYAHTILAIDAKKGGERQLKGLVDLCKKTLAAEGTAGFYRGFGASFGGACIYHGLYFATYESLKPAVLPGKMQDSFLGCFALAWASAIVSGSIVYPIDVVRRRAMAIRIPGKWECLAVATEQLLDSKHVMRAAFAGDGANIPRAIVGAAVLAAYDTNLDLLFP